MQPITLSDFSGAAGSLSELVDLIKKAVESWNDTCGILLTYTSSTSSADIVIGTTNLGGPGGTVGVGGFQSASTSSNHWFITDGFVQLDKNEGGANWSSSDVHSTVAHEIGHAIGFSHTGPDSTVNALMEPFLNSNLGPAPDDRWYSQFLYGVAPAKLSGNASQSDQVTLSIGRATPIQLGTDSDDNFQGDSMVAPPTGHGPGTGTGVLEHDSISKYIVERTGPNDSSFAVLDSNVQGPGTNNADGDLSHAQNAFNFVDNGAFVNGAVYKYRVKAVFASAGNDSLYSDEVSVTVTVTIPPPVVTNLAPNSGIRGTNNLDVVITGSNFHTGGNNVTFSGSGISVDGVVRNSATQLTATIDIAAGATLGARNVTVTNLDDGGAALVANGFTVEAPAPSITSINPSLVLQGFAGDVVIMGSNFHNEGGTPAVTLSGTGVSSTGVTFNSSSQLTVGVSVTAGATLGFRNVTVTNPDAKNDVETNGFRVHALPVAIFTGNLESGQTGILAGEDVDFSALASNDPDGGAIANFAWNFGDGATSPSDLTGIPSHTYAAPGAYTVTLVVTDDEGVDSFQAQMTVLVSGGADDGDLHASTGSFSVRFNKTNADAFMLRGLFSPANLPTNLTGLHFLLELNGVDQPTGALDSRGAFASATGVLPGVRYALSARAKSYSISLRSANLLATLDPDNVTSSTLTQTVAVRLRITNAAETVSYVDAAGQFQFSVRSTQGLSSSGRFSASKNPAYGGFFVAPRVSARENPASKGGGFILSASGNILPAGGGELAINDGGSNQDVRLIFGTMPAPIDVPSSTIPLSGTPPRITYRLNTRDVNAPPELASLMFTGSNKGFRVSTRPIQGTGIPLVGSGLLTHLLDITIVIQSPDGPITFQTSYLLAKTGDTSTSWR
ncbi:MAG: PKD domain-containing protein [Planctomycetota bacterium]|nr:PKD domain-containing protein [Planctomycetota bacterium]